MNKSKFSWVRITKVEGWVLLFLTVVFVIILDLLCDRCVPGYPAIVGTALISYLLFASLYLGLKKIIKKFIER
jgi:hypothetical protein